MTTQSSSAPRTPTDNKPQNPGSEVVQPTLEDQKNMAEATQDPAPTISNVQPAGTDLDGQVKSSSNIQPQDPSRSLQPAVVAPAGAISKVGTLSRFHWSRALLAVGLLAVSGAGTAVLFKNTTVPRLKSWIRKVAMEEDEDTVEKQHSKPSAAVCC